MRLLFGFFKSVCLSPEIVKQISQLKLIDELQAKLASACKNEKDIKLQKNWLMNYVAFLASFAHTDEGRRAVVKIKPCFEMALFVIDTISPPAGTADVGPLTQLVINVFTFLRNCSLE